MTRVATGPVSRVANAYDGMFTGTINVAFPAVPIYQEQKQILEVLVQNDPTSGANAMVGNALNGQYIVLVPGDSITIPINDLNKVHVGTAGGGAKINFLAMV